MDEKSYKGIQRSDLDTIRTELGKYGIHVPEGDNVEVKGPLGVRMQVLYDEPNETLNLAILQKPAFVPRSQIWKVIEMSAAKFQR